MNRHAFLGPPTLIRTMIEISLSLTPVPSWHHGHLHHDVHEFYPVPLLTRDPGSFLLLHLHFRDTITAF